MRMMSLRVGAGESTARDLEGANRQAVIALEHLSVTRERLAVELEHLRGGSARNVLGDEKPEMKIAEGESQVGGGVFVRAVVMTGRRDTRGGRCWRR